MIEELSQFFHGITYVGAQHILAEKLVEHLSDRTFQECDTTGVSRTMPGIGTVRGVVGERAKKRRHDGIEIGPRLAPDVTRQELRRIFQHMDEAVQLAQDVVRNMARGAGFAMQKNGNLGIAEANLFHKGTQIRQGQLRLFRRA